MPKWTLPWHNFVNLVLAHKLDPAWLIALWLAIHGGDPVPETIEEFVALNALSSLSTTLKDVALQERLNEALAPVLKEYQGQAESEGRDSDARSDSTRSASHPLQSSCNVRQKTLFGREE